MINLGAMVVGALGAHTAVDPAHITRAAAISAYVTLALAVSVGMLRGMLRKARGRSSWLLDELHQFIALLAAALVALHLAALALNPLLPFPAIAVIEPVGDPQRPLAHALGALGLYALVVVLVSSWLRKRLPYRLWRWLHFASFVTFCAVTAHGLLAGTDTAQPWMRAIYLGCGCLVALLLIVRACVPARAPQVAVAIAQEGNGE